MDASPTPNAIPDVVVYGRPGCHLCEEAVAALVVLLGQRASAGRAAPRLVERDITTDPAWEREFIVTIPVVEVGARRLELATSVAKLRAFLAAELDGEPAAPAQDA